MRTVEVQLGDRSYPILIGAGLLAQLGHHVAARLPGARVAIVTDTHVEPLHGKAVRSALDAAGIAHDTQVVPAGEASKSWEVLGRVVDFVLAGRFERGDAVLALGGGVVGDLAGFAAAIARRGMALVQVPTSLLAQVDSSVGGKTGINSARGKNLIGAFHQPSLVVADIDTLATLPDREFRAGYAEVAKYGLIDRPDFFGWLEENLDAIAGRDPDLLAQAIATCCEAKSAVVAADEREAGARALLNLGHTFGHALEAACGYDAGRLVHGEAVSIGCVLAHGLSNRLGLSPSNDEARVAEHLARIGLPTSPRAVAGLPDAAALVELMRQDKKAERGALTFILTRGIGRAFVEKGVDPDAVTAFLEERL